MYKSIKGIILKTKEDKYPFCNMLVKDEAFDTEIVKIGSIVTTGDGTEYEIIDISAINLKTCDVELIVEKIKKWYGLQLQAISINFHML